ncbi:MAG: cobalt-precorrin-5B (C(1))-methyltransferase [Chloroflexota bacterium]|nr:cobalt-precorrin-5B (C(1))-methyltransferase [Chloroflexota bacterium]
MSKRKGTLRSGYTTGSCAAAAARAAAIALLEQTMIEEVGISLPDGQRVQFKLNDCAFDIREASCSVIKNAGDDPDITDGAEVRAAVCWKDDPGIAIEGGEGVGMVTKPGLDVPIGKPAINNVPLMMIEQNVAEVIGNDKGLRVVVSVPEGKELAKKTLNKRLGIIGGISILGTSGVVIPYSIDAYQASISQALDIAVASGCYEAVLTTGRRSEKYAQREFPFAEEAFVQMGDFVGYALQQCASREIRKVIIWGMVGKLSKIANKDFYTNISDSKIDMDFLAGVAVSCGVAESKVATAREAVTAHHFLKIVGKDESREVCDELCFLASVSSRQYVDGAFGVECVMSTYDGTILGRGSDKG